MKKKPTDHVDQPSTEETPSTETSTEVTPTKEELRQQRLEEAATRRQAIVNRNEAKQELVRLHEAWEKQMAARINKEICIYCESPADICGCHKEVAQVFMEYRFMNPLFE